MDGNFCIQKDQAFASHKDIWAEVRADLRGAFSLEDYETKLTRIVLVGDWNGSPTLVAPTVVARDWARQHAAPLIQTKWAEIARRRDLVDASAELRIEAASGLPAEMQGAYETLRLAGVLEMAETDPAAAPHKHANGLLDAAVRKLVEGQPGAAPGDSARAEEGFASAPLSKRCTFETYRVGESNRVATTVAKRVADGRESAFGLVLFHGGYGNGKTHLLQSIANEALRKRPARRVLYLSAEMFLVRFLAALRRKDMAAFKSVMRQIDLLIIDDVHFIAGKEATEEEFFHTIAALLSSDKQVVLSADAGPEGLKGLDERLRSHLKGGLACEIREPDFELRRRILETKAQHYSEDIPGFDPPAVVLDFIASRIQGSGRDMEGALKKLAAGTTLQGRPITCAAAEEALKAEFAATMRNPSVELIQKATARYYGMSQTELLSRSRRRCIVRPRQVSMFLCRRLTTRSLPDIGFRFDKRDHTTVIHAVRSIEALSAEDAKIAHDIEAITRMIRE